mgnify:FL=1
MKVMTSRKVVYSIVTPAHNEEGNIEKFVLRIVKTIERHKLDAEIIVVDDVSCDKTGEIADRLSDRYKMIRVIHRSSNNGPGNAERAGFAIAKGEWIITLDSDLSHRPEEIPVFIDKAIHG